ncbi:mucin-4-like [Arapaima gigas]
MLPSPLITVLAPHWTGRFRRYKLGTERQGAGQQVNEKDEAARGEVDCNKNDQKPHQVRDMRFQRSLGTPAGQVHNTGLIQVSVTQGKPLPSRSGQRTMGWVNESYTTATNSLSASVSPDHSRSMLDNRRRATVNCITSPLHQGTARSGSVDLCYQRTSLVNHQDPSLLHVSESSSPSNLLPSLRKVTSLHENSKTHIQSASSPLPDTQSCSAEITPMGPEEPKSSAHFTADRLRCGHVDESDQLLCLNNQSLTCVTTLNSSPLKEHGRLDGITPTKEGSTLLGYRLGYHVLTGSNHSHNTNTTSIPNNSTGSFNTRNNYGVFGRPAQQVPSIHVAVTQSSHVVTSPNSHHHISSQTLPNTPVSPNGSNRFSPDFQPLSPSQTWGQMDRALSSPIFSFRGENCSFERAVPTHAWKAHLDNRSAAARRNRFHASSSPTSLTSSTLPRQSPQSVDSSVTDSQMTLSSPTLSAESLQRMNNVSVQKDVMLFASPTRSPHSPHSSLTLNSSIKSSKGSSSSTTAITLASSIQAKNLNAGDTRTTLLSYRMLTARPVCSIDAPTPYSSLRQSSPPKAISLVQRSPGLDLQGGELPVSPSNPTPEARVISWRQHYFHGKKHIWSTVDFDKEGQKKTFQRLSSVPSDSTRTPYSDKPVTPSPFLEQHLGRKSLDNESETLPTDSIGNRSSIHPDSSVSNSRKSFSEEMEKLTTQHAPFGRLWTPTAEAGNYVPRETPKGSSFTVDLSKLLSRQQPTDLTSTGAKWTNVDSSFNSDSPRTTVSADPPDDYIQLCNSSPVFQTNDSSSVNTLHALRSLSAAPNARSKETTEKLSAEEQWPVVESQMESFKDQNPKRSLLTVKSNEDQFSLSSPVVTAKPPIPYSKSTRADVAGNKSGNKVDVFLNRIKMTFSSKRSDNEVLNSRKKSRKETPLPLCRKSDVTVSNDPSDVRDVLKLSDHENKADFTECPQVSRLSALSPWSEYKLSEARKLGSSLHNLTDTNGNHSELRSQWIPAKHQTLSPTRWSINAGPRKSSVSPRTSEMDFDFNSEDRDCENVFYSKRSLERQLKTETTAKASWISSSRQLSEGDNKRNLFRSRSRNNSYNESQLCFSTSSDFSLKGARSFSVSSIHASRPSGSARMATIPRMASVDNLTNVCVRGGALGQRSRVLSCNLDQTASRNHRWDLVTTDQIWPHRTLESSRSLRDEDLSPSPPPSPTCSPRPISRPPSFSTVSSLTSQDSLSPRGQLPSRGYKSSLSAFEESDPDTTTDDEYYLSDDKGERETEL